MYFFFLKYSTYQSARLDENYASLRNHIAQGDLWGEINLDEIFHRIAFINRNNFIKNHAYVYARRGRVENTRSSVTLSNTIESNYLHSGFESAPETGLLNWKVRWRILRARWSRSSVPSSAIYRQLGELRRWIGA